MPGNNSNQDILEHIKSIATPIGAHDIAFGKISWMMNNSFSM